MKTSIIFTKTNIFKKFKHKKKRNVDLRNLPNYTYYVKAHHLQLSLRLWESLIKDPISIKEANEKAKLEDNDSTDQEESADSDDDVSDVSSCFVKIK
jgi:hypothetical protein